MHTRDVREIEDFLQEYLHSTTLDRFTAIHLFKVILYHMSPQERRPFMDDICDMLDYYPRLKRKSVKHLSLHEILYNQDHYKVMTELEHYLKSDELKRIIEEAKSVALALENKDFISENEMQI